MVFLKYLGAVFLALALTTKVGFSQETRSVDELFSNVKAVAIPLKAFIDEELPKAFADSLNSREKGAKALESMLEAARNVQNRLDADSEIWIELNNLLTMWAERRDKAMRRAEDDPRFARAAELWQANIDRATQLRTQILDQAAFSQVLIDRIEADRDIVLEYYDIGLASEAIKILQQVSEQLGEMNAQMQEIVDQTGVIATDAVVQ